MNREKCPQCEFIKSRCLCKSIIQIRSPIKVIIVQFPKEKKHPLNTVNILKKNLNELIIIEDEKVDENSQFIEIIEQLTNPVLIFKNEYSNPIETEISIVAKKIDGIIFIDGSWNKAKRIYFQSQILQRMKTYSLNRIEMSEYKIRKSPIKEGLSTIESVAYTLEFLTSNTTYRNLLDPFHQMIEDQISKMGLEIFNEFYVSKTKKER